jgi:hypothetical protein
MPSKRPHNDESHWRLRDNFTWYTEQAKAAPVLVKSLVSVPRVWFGAVKEMVEDMRGDARGAGDASDRAEDRRE